MTGYTYMLASQKNGTIYIGVTGDLARRIPQHKERQGKGFTARYDVVRMVWYEEFFDNRDAIQRKKSLGRLDQLPLGSVGKRRAFHRFVALRSVLYPIRHPRA